ncbi:putative Histidine kinase [Candidatus Terasakiella magnetica]|uniref:Sensory/regulatory protein RpfC n=1 Tax=Candidatus Terasakiella magnetica TaxID=1867952 RepID=A0A1C3RIX2_9PROT|nr:ATP-binding protein [Candidatus Terasakiella magnetica]SCA57219.1 putative Histidine kinase [Candidatus Terasakiella magnetica]
MWKELKLTKLLLVLAMIMFVLSFPWNMTVRFLMDDLSEQWKVYNTTLEEADINLNKVRREIGYGGFIHHFKNYIIRRDDIYYKAALENYTNAMVYLNEIEVFMGSPEVNKHINVLRSTLLEYEQKLHKARGSVTSVVELDNLSKVNDIGALQAIGILAHKIEEARHDKLLTTEKGLAELKNLLTFNLFIPIPALLMAIFAFSMLRRNEEKGIALTKERATLNTILENAPDAMLVVDTTGSVTKANQEALNFFGYSLEELIGKKVEDLMPERYRHAHIGQRDKVYRSHQDGAYDRPPMEMKGLTKEGQEVNVAIKLNMAEIEGVKSSLLSLRDITPEVQLRQHLEEAKLKAEIANEAKSRFLATMSHEIRTPMNGVIGMTDLLLESKLDEEQLHYAQTIRSSGEMLISLINDILDLSKLESDKVVLENLTFDLHELVESSYEIMAAAARYANVTLSIEYDEKAHLSVCGDPTRIRQILLNLIGNAIKFAKDETVSIRVSTLEEQDTSTLIRFEVVDTGIGISPDALPSLFETFTQADGSMSRRYGGAGLGLSICKGLVEKMGGVIQAESQLGKGSRFWFDIPLQKAQDDEAIIELKPKQANKEKGSTERQLNLLVVEDNLINQKVVVGILSKYGHNITIANNGQEALEQVSTQPFDLILMDLQMPVMTGLEATMQLKAMDKPICDIPIIALTANAYQQDINNCLEAGMLDFIAKPFTAESLLNTIDQHIAAQ